MATKERHYFREEAKSVRSIRALRLQSPRPNAQRRGRSFEARTLQLGILLAFALAAALPICGQDNGEKAARELSGFEAGWIAAGLNNDQAWLTRYFAGRLSVRPAVEAAKDRGRLIAGLLDPGVPSNEVKVRITGTVSLLTNDPARNRSFRFLDTFNKRGGKWEVIAVSFAPIMGSGETSDSKRIEDELTHLENAWAGVHLPNDRAVFDRIVALEFVGTGVDGTVRDRDEWVKAGEREAAGNSVSKDVVVRAYSDTLAIVTGVKVTTRSEEGREVIHEDRFTDTWLKRGSGWQVIAAQVMRLK